jgi:hypothetical protein
VSSYESKQSRHGGVDALAGFLAAASIGLSAVALAESPARLGPVAILLALLAARMSTRWERLSLAAMVAAMIGFTAGMAFAVLTGNPIY